MLESFENRNTHLRLDGSTYFVTWRLHSEQPELKPQEKSLVAAAIEHFHGNRYTLQIYAVMDDHAHVIAAPEPEHDLSQIIHSWKSYTANQLQRSSGRKGSIWQKDHYERIIRSEADLAQKMEYIYNNPVKEGLDSHSYEWLKWF